MKKIILSCCVLACSAALFAGCASKEKVKAQFVEKCKSALPGTIPKELGDEYCNCSADKLMTKYSVTEIATLEQKMLAGDEKAKADMMQAIQPCLDELTKKAAAQQSK